MMGINLVPNPSFEVDTSNWTGTRGTITRDATESHFGSAACRYDSDTAVTGTRFAQSEVIPVLGGETYTASSYIWLGSTFNEGQVQINWRSDSGFISSDLGATTPIDITPARASVTATAPNNAVEATVGVSFRPDPGITAASAFFDGVMLNEGELITYLEGDGSLIDQMMAALIAEGFTVGTIVDREYSRLLALLSTVIKGNTIIDLYEQALEPPRVFGKLRE